MHTLAASFLTFNKTQYFLYVTLELDSSSHTYKMAQAFIFKLLAPSSRVNRLANPLNLLSTSAARLNGIFTNHVRNITLWEKRLSQSLKTQNMYKVGAISCRDVHLIVQHYTDVESSSEHIRKFQNALQRRHEEKSTAIAYDEFSEYYNTRFLKTADDRNPPFIDDEKLADAEGDESPTFDEWVEHYNYTGVDPNYVDTLDADGDISAEDR